MKSLIKYLLIFTLIVIIFLNLNFFSKTERQETVESPKVQQDFVHLVLVENVTHLNETS